MLILLLLEDVEILEDEELVLTDEEDVEVVVPATGGPIKATIIPVSYKLTVVKDVSVVIPISVPEPAG